MSLSSIVTAHKAPSTLNLLDLLDRHERSTLTAHRPDAGGHERLRLLDRLHYRKRRLQKSEHALSLHCGR